MKSNIFGFVMKVFTKYLSKIFLYIYYKNFVLFDSFQFSYIRVQCKVNGVALVYASWLKSQGI